MKRALFLVLLIALSAESGMAQVTTRSDGNESKDETPGKKGKILVIPCRPTMFNAESDVSRGISQETGQNYNQIQEAFRRGTADQFRSAFGGKYQVTTLLDDTVKMKKDLEYVYNVSALEYIPVNAPLNPAPAAKQDPKKNPQQKGGIKNGQVATDSDEIEKFMNVNILSPNTLGYLKSKYGCDYVVFVNQFDLKNDLGSDPYNVQGKTDFLRSVTIHYTVWSTATEKRVLMGKLSAQFPSSSNNTKKIIAGPVNSVIRALFSRFEGVVSAKK
ncbi:MAG: hypothetical protein Fur0041_00040 [Bacteroidia bacterium]